jgi:hypothetical protein
LKEVIPVSQPGFALAFRAQRFACLRAVRPALAALACWK